MKNKHISFKNDKGMLKVYKCNQMYQHRDPYGVIVEIYAMVCAKVSKHYEYKAHSNIYKGI